MLGALPGLPKVAVHWPLIDFECGPVEGADDVHRVVLQGRPRRARAVRPGRRGLDPERGDQGGGLLVRLRQRPGDRPADHHQRVARPARPEGARRSSRSAPARPTAASTPWPATRPARWASPTTSAGTGRSKAGLPIVCVPGCPIQPDNLSETILYLLYQVAGQAPMIPLDEELRPHLALRRDRARGLRPRGLLRAGRLRRRSTARPSAS